MINTIDGFTFGNPPDPSNIIALAHHHRKQLDEAIFHQEIHLGNYCLDQRKRVYDFTRSLDATARAEFYRYYDGELKRIAHKDDLHPADAEGGVGIFTVFIVLAIIAAILYFGIVQNVVG